MQFRLDGPSPATPICLEWSPDDTRIAIGYNRGEVVDLWTGRDGDHHGNRYTCMGGHSFGAVVHGVAYKPGNGYTVASAPSMGMYHVFGAPYDTWHHAAGRYPVIKWSPDGRCLAASGEGHCLLVKDTESYARYEHTAPITSLEWEPNNRPLVATASINGRAILFDLLSHSTTQTKVEGGVVLNLAWHPSGGMVALAGNGSTYARATLWDIVHETVFKMSCSARDTNWSPDGSLVAFASDDGAVHVADARTQSDTHTFHHDTCATSVRWSPDSSRILSASTDKTARVWDIRKGTEDTVARVTHEDWVVQAKWSHDGKRFATCSHDLVVRVTE